MWFDIHPTSIPKPAPSPTIVKDSCHCYLRRMRVNVVNSSSVNSLKDLVSALGDGTCVETTLMDGSKQAEIHFHDCRDAIKMFELLSKLPDWKACTLVPIPEESQLLKISVPKDIYVATTKEQIYYELFKHGELSYFSVNSNDLSCRNTISCAFFDSRLNHEAANTPLIVNGLLLKVSIHAVNHVHICRFRNSSPHPTVYPQLPSQNFRTQPVHIEINTKVAQPQCTPPLNDVTAFSPFLTPTTTPTSSKFKNMNMMTPPFNHNENEPSTSTNPKACDSALNENDSSATTTDASASVASSPASTASSTSTSGPGTTKKSAKSNKVDLESIAAEKETRTTIMLRNIPNKVDVHALRKFLDETNKNTYDFLYLRMDFANKCNVGYAFINFTHPKHIATLTKARRGKRWSQYNSLKVIDVSFANIQGCDALVQKFRDSPIICMEPEYRPKLFYTSGELIGQERSFY